MDHARVGRAGHIAGRKVEVLSGCSAGRYPTGWQSTAQATRTARSASALDRAAPHTVSGAIALD